VAFFLAIDADEARAMDADSPDSLAHAAEDIASGGVAVEDLNLHHIARWHDVHTAAARIARRNWLISVTGELVVGESQDTIASRLGYSHAKLSRDLRASIDQLLAELNTAPRIV
jgi:hypothetical protein